MTQYWPDDDEHFIDLGDNHWITYYGWRPDRDLNPGLADRPDIDKLGATVWHVRPDGTRCAGGVTFDVPGAEHFPGAKWQVVSWDPLTITPSLLCKAPLDGGGECGDHGFITDGRWVRA